ncbi:uncharacterized protein LOC143296293 [Babylonia areolata]|uniref:uncharacterized protein LOC143296293 n=1 Tax=Babylonia areolata TaxID=304850 RepID=UPI003FD07402
MAEILKGKRSTGRRSSILKRALADIDVNEKAEVPRTKSKRVSFAETCCVKEFARDSPQVLKAAEHDDSANTSADNSLHNVDVAPNTINPQAPEVDRPLPDNAGGSSFMLDDGETTFIGDMANHGGFCESTRRFDRLDSCMFGGADVLDVSEITQGDNTVFAPAVPSMRGTSTATCTTTLTSSYKYSVGSTAVERKQAPLPKTLDRPAVLKRAPEINFPPSQGDRTLLFDNQDGGTMDLTLSETSRGDFSFQNSPKVSARDFLNKMMRGKKGPEERQEQHTILFSDTGRDGNAMELTQNLTEHNFTSDLRAAPQVMNPLSICGNMETASTNNGFGTRNVGSLSPENIPKVSAKSFLATLRQNLGSMPTSMLAPELTSLNRSGAQGPSQGICESEQREEGDMTMELTCVDPVSKPITQTVSTSGTIQHVLSMAQKCNQQEVLNTVENEDVTEMMELTGCVDNTLKSLVGASGLAVTSINLGTQQEANNSSRQNRNALMDITASFSVSPPPGPQLTVETEQVYIKVPSNQVPQNAALSTTVQDFTGAGQSCSISNSTASVPALMPGKDSSTSIVFMGQENADSNYKNMSLVNHQGNRVPLKSMQQDRKVPAPVPDDCQVNSSVCLSRDQARLLSFQNSQNHTVHFAAGDDMEMTNAFTSNIPDQVSTSVRSIQGIICQPPSSTQDQQHDTSAKNGHRKDSHERSVPFNMDDTAANMSLTCTTLPHTVPQRRSSVNRTVTFGKEDTVANMSLTCAITDPFVPVDKSQSHKTVLYGEETGANMSLTCTSLSSKQAGNKSLTNRSILFRTEETAADMNMTCDDLQPTDQKDITSKTDNAAVNMSLTCAALSQTQLGKDDVHTTAMPVTEKQQLPEKSIVFAREATVANMSLTCADLSSSFEQNEALSSKESQVAAVKSGQNTVPSEKHQTWERSILFSKEATAANMSLTCADLSAVENLEQKEKSCLRESETLTFKDPSQNTTTVPTEKSRVSERSILFSKEATAANMSLTCANLSSSFEQNEALSSMESQVAAVKSGQNTVPSEKHQTWERSILFSKEATAANMSLTCADLSAVENLEQKEKSCLRESETLTFKDPSQNTTAVPTEKSRVSERSILFSKEATAANMSLTCADLPAVHNTDNNPALYSEKNVVKKQDEDKTKTFQNDHSLAAMDMTCMSPVARSEHSMDKVNQQQQPMILEISTKLNQTQPLPSDANKCSTDALSSSISDQKHEHDMGETEDKETDDVFFKREPTTLMEITSVLDNLRKKMEERVPSEETGTETTATQVEKMSHDLPTTGQTKQENVNTATSRKLQLSPTKKGADMFDSHPETSQSDALLSCSLKRPLQSLNTANKSLSKTLRLSSQSTLDSSNISSPATSKSSDIFREPRPVVSDEERTGGTNSLPAASRSMGSTSTSMTQNLSRSSSSSSSSSNSSSQSLRSVDIFSETMPVFGPAGSNTSAASMSAMSMSALHNATGSFLSLGRSFVDKQEKVDERSSFLQTCEQLGITQSDLKGWVCRRSSVAVRPEVSCDTVEDQLNSASVVRQECEFKVEFVSAMDAMQQREEMSTEELEKMVMRQIGQLGLVAESEQSQSVRQQIRSLLFAGRKHAQVLWKTHKAERLNALTQKMERHYQAVSADMEDMTTCIEQMATLKENVDDSISQLQSQLESLKSQVSTKKRRTRHEAKHEELLRQRSDMVPLQEQVSDAKRSVEQLTQKEQNLQKERECVQRHCQMNMERQRQLDQAHQALSALHCLHCWRPVRMEDHQIDVLVLYDAVLLSIRLSGGSPSSPSQPVTGIVVTSRLTEGTEPWAALAAKLAVDSLSASSQHLVHSFPSRQHLPLLLDQVTGAVEDIKGLCQELKLASIHHHVTITGTRVTAKLWSTERLRQLSLTTDVPVNSYPHNPLSWSIQVIMGDVCEKQLQAAIGGAGAGRGHLTRVLQVVQALLQR